MLVATYFAARFTVRRFALPTGVGVRLTVGGIALALMLCAEVLLAAVLQGRSAAQYIASRDPVAGSVYLGMLGIFAVMPLILAQFHGGQSYLVEIVDDEPSRTHLWALADRVFPPFARYRESAARTGRTIPILQLVPRGRSAEGRREQADGF